MQSNCLILALGLLLVVGFVAAAAGDRDQWVWHSANRQQRSFRDGDIGRSRSAAIRNSFDTKLRREPTTRRPLPGEPENDEIEDYADVVDPTRTSQDSTPNVGTRQYNPYGGQPNAGQFGGSGLSGGYGGSPGVLVGPGGPTGIIGRQPLYPSPYQPGYGGFNGAQNGIGGYPGGIYGGASGSGLQGYPTAAGTGAGYPGGSLGGGFGGFPSNGLGGGQFPGVGQQFPSGGQQFPGAGQQFPGAGGQFPGAGGQYPFGGSFPGGDFSGSQFAGQFPGIGGQQFPSNQFGGGPQYTEGYGLAGGVGLGQQLGIGAGGGLGPYGGGNFGFDEKSASSPVVAEGKSAKSVAAAPRNVNDKLSKKI
ncbi:glycine-rich cell wall structural protein [Drosophila subobscura]|uniref:glycine-rich cell wall structural protein n=1 Tax=Drosophila subobscura TaxID=7241 RepID=UPI00155AFBD2|nr:glycine-rich cell wall structural protein [Drosophila subobscura]